MMRTSVAFILFTLLLLAGAIAHLSIGARVIAPRTVVDAFSTSTRAILSIA